MEQDRDTKGSPGHRGSGNGPRFPGSALGSKEGPVVTNRIWVGTEKEVENLHGLHPESVQELTGGERLGGPCLLSLWGNCLHIPEICQPLNCVSGHLYY